MANFKNLAFGRVKIPPSPPTSGTTVILEAGHGARFPALPFTATVWPVTVMPDPLTAEVVLVTAILNDTLTIVRAHEGTTARAIIPGDQLAGTITEAYLATVPSKGDGVVDWAGSHTIAGDLSVAGATDLQALAVHGPLTATDLTVAANATVGGQLAVGGGAVINGSTIIAGGLNVSGNATMAGDLTVAGLIQSAHLRSYSEPWHQQAVSGGTFTIDFAAGNHVFVYLTENVASITIVNLPTAGNVIVPVMLYYVATGGPRTVAHVINGHGVRFPAGQQPVMSSDNGYIDRILYSTWDNGVTWLGDIIGIHY